MPTASNESANPIAGIPRERLQPLVFLIILPTLNTSMAALVLADLGEFRLRAMLLITLRLWLMFVFALVLIRVAQRLLRQPPGPRDFWSQFALHAACILASSLLLAQVMAPLTYMNIEISLIAPRVLFLLEVAIYLGVLKLISERDQFYAERLARQETELSMLRSQSNPHFLFNTLNLITAEVSNNPEKAREIVYDLSDLLRSNIQIAKEKRSTVADEFKLVELFLELQQKRFEERLTFEIDLEPGAAEVEVPPLLLQPIVENTIKHSVSPYAASAHLKISARLDEDRLAIEFRDTGPPFDESDWNEGNGFRILRKTLSLAYGDDYALHLRSTTTGGVLSLDVPTQRSVSKNE